MSYTEQKYSWDLGLAWGQGRVRRDLGCWLGGGKGGLLLRDPVPHQVRTRQLCEPLPERKNDAWRK